MLLLRIILYFTVAGGLLACDPQTQYESQDGQCCKKCRPGTRMLKDTNCLDPQCTVCAEGEYQDAYTENEKCELQPYCDPNKNFESDALDNKEKRRECKCKEGYHCSSQACITCLKHSSCRPGQRVLWKGTDARDTVCQNCPPNTFSTENRLDTDCQNWTVCGPGFQVNTSGTATSDTVCEITSRFHIMSIFPIIIIIVVVIVVCLFLYCKRRGNSTNDKEKQDADQHILISEPLAAKTPEENEHQQVQSEMPSPNLILDAVAFTENGNLLAQDAGKTHIISRQESQLLSLPSV